MKTSTFSLLTILLVILWSASCFGQQKEFEPRWEIRVASGQSFVDYFNGFESVGMTYGRGMTIKPELVYDFSRFVSGSFSLFFTTAHEGDKNASYLDVFATNKGARVFNHYQTTLAPEIQISPIKSKRHNLYIGAGPTYTFGSSSFSQTWSEASTTMARSIEDFGYQATLGYKFKICKNWSIGANYIYNQNEVKTEHILFAVGYRIK